MESLSVSSRLAAVTWFRSANDCCQRYRSLRSSQAGRPLQSAKRPFKENVAVDGQTAKIGPAGGRYRSSRTGGADPLQAFARSGQMTASQRLLFALITSKSSDYTSLRSLSCIPKSDRAAGHVRAADFEHWLSKCWRASHQYLQQVFSTKNLIPGDA